MERLQPGSALTAFGSDDIPGTPLAEGSLRGLRVALFSGNYNMIRDGASNALNRLAGYLLARGAAVRVYSPTTADPAFAPAGDLVSVPSIAIPGRPEYRFAYALARSTRDDLRRFGPTVIHVSAPDALGWQAQSFARKLGVPVVASLHTRFETYFGYYGIGGFRRAAEAYLRHFYGRSDLVLVPSKEVADCLAGWGLGDRIALWSRGVDRQLFSPARRSREWRRAHGYRDDEAIVLFFGRIVREKGVAVFADTIRQLRAKGHRLRPLVIGKGPAQAEFAAALGDACFTGHLDGVELATAVASADILFNPSVTEAFGNVNLEGMAAGVAVVAADVPGSRALIGEERPGLLIDPDEPGEYARAIERLLQDALLRRSLAREGVKVASRYDWDKALSAVVRAYFQALSRQAQCAAELAAAAA
jgi:glycosyltransferase involved in cell wall biosynthesis